MIHHSSCFSLQSQLVRSALHPAGLRNPAGLGWQKTRLFDTFIKTIGKIRLILGKIYNRSFYSVLLRCLENLSFCMLDLVFTRKWILNWEAEINSEACSGVGKENRLKQKSSGLQIKYVLNSKHSFIPLMAGMCKSKTKYLN